jgi:predicted MFS family arabinose efflux permease
VEGAGEVAMGIAAAIAAPLAGLVLATRGYGAVSLAGGLVALVALVFITRSQPWRSRHETAHL